MPTEILLVRADSNLHNALGVGPAWAKEVRVTSPFKATLVFTITTLVWPQGSIKRPEAFAFQKTHTHATLC